jgi:hypothetical protein
MALARDYQNMGLMRDDLCCMVRNTFAIVRNVLWIHSQMCYRY